MTNFYQQYKSINPFLRTTKKPEDGKEYKQTIADRKKIVSAVERWGIGKILSEVKEYQC